MMSGSGTTNIPKAYNSYLNKGQEVAVDGPGPKIRVCYRQTVCDGNIYLMMQFNN